MNYFYVILWKQLINFKIFPNHVLVGFNPLNLFFIDDQIDHLLIMKL